LKSYIPEPENKIVEIVRIIVIVGGVGVAILAGLFMTALDYITGRDYES